MTIDYKFPYRGNAASVRNCELVGLPDLDQSRSNVRQQLINYMNRLIDLGVAGELNSEFNIHDKLLILA